ncbi:hypothetical protein [Pedobacter kyungheensis]|nr:hypothetical protein [Pedobacter kyungheensis]
MRLISCAALLMVIPAVALLMKAEDFTANKPTNTDAPQLKNNSKVLSVAHLSATQATVKDDAPKDAAFKTDCSPRFDGSSYFTNIPLLTKP